MTPWEWKRTYPRLYPVYNATLVVLWVWLSIAAVQRNDSVGAVFCGLCLGSRLTLLLYLQERT